MGLPATLTLPQRPPSMPNANELVEQTRGHAARVFQAVATAYLAFRREYYHETQLTLATIPLRAPRLARRNSRSWPSAHYA
jgi:hypothetical protein